MRLDGLPDALRDFQLEPILTAGWLTRGLNLTIVKGSIDHHTAGAPVGYFPSQKTLTFGRGGANPLPGPLCNVGAPRAADGDNKVFIIAAGKANHAGAGYWNGADSNYELCGLERELTGTSPPTEWQNEVAARVHAAFAKLCGFPAENVARHAEYALPKGRKIDTYGMTGTWLRNRVAQLLTGTNPPIPGPPTQEEIEMELEFVYMMHEFYLGVPRNTTNVADRRSIDYWLGMILGGFNKNAMRLTFAAQAIKNKTL